MYDDDDDNRNDMMMMMIMVIIVEMVVVMMTIMNYDCHKNNNHICNKTCAHTHTNSFALLKEQLSRNECEYQLQIHYKNIILASTTVPKDALL